MQTTPQDDLDLDLDFLAEKIEAPKFQSSFLSANKAKKRVRSQLRSLERMTGEQFTHFL